MQRTFTTAAMGIVPSRLEDSPGVATLTGLTFQHASAIVKHGSVLRRMSMFAQLIAQQWLVDYLPSIVNTSGKLAAMMSRWMAGVVKILRFLSEYGNVEEQLKQSHVHVSDTSSEIFIHTRKFGFLLLLLFCSKFHHKHYLLQFPRQ